LTAENQAEQKENIIEKRAAFYIDGFNLYHAIDEMGKDYLKWVSYWELCKNLLTDPSAGVVKVVWCTAKSKKSPDKGERHDRMVTAQRLAGVTVRLGHFIDETKDCRTCKANWVHPSEKEGDINVAINLIRDAFRNEYDHAFLVTADTDQAATVRMFIEEFEHKKITIVAPPVRKRSEHLHNIAKDTVHLTEDMLEKAVMPGIILSPSPRTIPNVRRPEKYAPPLEWVHPQNRPQK
jgi:uncharacterized LabA/DUF88 family protein